MNKKKIDPELLAYQNAIIANQESILAHLNQVLANQEQFQIQHELIGVSENFVAVIKQAQSVAGADCVVLLRGETGTGKELLAHHIHLRSQRCHLPMMTVNCAALPDGLIETELFGHEKGSFTGAMQRKRGKFEVADGGTIFLDEIGEVPIEAQAKFLRVLQDGVFERIGGTQPLQTNVRVIAATNQPLEELIEERRFRSDLFYRLNVFPITIPPLRDRREDLLPLAKFFAQKYSVRFGKAFSRIHDDAVQGLYDYSWPGNVRELQHVIERAVLVSEGEELWIELPKEYVRASAQQRDAEAAEALPGASNGSGPATPAAAATFTTLQENERRYIEAVLLHTRGRVHGTRGAAAILGIPPSTLRSRMKKLGIAFD
jgi:formate hydrogenlyase transcriptional activator